MPVHRCASIADAHGKRTANSLPLVWIGLEAGILLWLSSAHPPFLLSKVDVRPHMVYYTTPYYKIQ